MSGSTQKDGGIGWLIFGGLCVAAWVYSCSEKSGDTPVRSTETQKAAPAVPVPMASVPWRTPIPPNYVDFDGKTYFYTLPLSEEQRKNGQGAPDILSIRYLGRNGQGEDIIAHLSKGGQILYKTYCKNPCRVIRYDDGSRIGFNEGTPIGEMHADANRGNLKESATAAVNRRTASNPTAPQTTAVATQSPVEGDAMDAN